MAFSYASYAGNGSNKNFSVPFPYLLKAHVKVYTGFNILDGTYTSLLVEGTDYTWTSGTQVQTTVAPANGVTLTVLRDTPDSSQLVPWTDGSNLVSNDLNTADLQNLYVVQEQQDRNDAGVVQSLAAQTAANAATTAANTATSTANTALSTSNTALTNANAAVSTANTASTNASAAVSTANTAASNASAAVSTANAASSTANTASTNASNAVTTANAAAATAATALSTANTAATNASAAVSTANTASSNASAAVTTANTASTNASNAVTTANTASTNASAAVTTANTASTNASNAVTTANAADNKANQAIAAVSNSINYQLKANVAAIPASPANDTYIEVQDSTGLESFTPLAGMPAGFVGDSGLSVRLRYTTAGTTWNWLNYYANNSDSRYLKLTGGTLTGQIKADDSTSAATPGYAFDGDANTGIGRPGADELALITGGTARLTIDSSGSVAVAGALTKGGNNVVTVGDTGTVTSAMVADGTLVNADISATAAIDKTKISGTAITAADTGTVTNTMLAGSIAPSKVTGTAITAADTGTVTSTMVADGTLVNADINASAAIAGTKISPDFGSQNTTTTGTSTAASFIPTSSTVPTNGVYLPSANNVAISTNGQGRLFVDASGNVGAGTSSPTFSAGGGVQAKYATFSAFRATVGANTGTDFAASSDGTGYVYVRDNAGLIFGTSNTERMRLDSSGRLGLGTSSPAERLHVVDSAATVRIDSSAGNDIQVRFQQGSTFVGAVGYDSSEGCVYLNRFGDATKGLVVNSSNNVGIGTTDIPSDTNLAVLGNFQSGFYRNVTSGNRGYFINIGAKTSTGFADAANVFGGLDSGDSTGYLSFGTRTSGSVTEKARIDSSGNLLVNNATSIFIGQYEGGSTNPSTANYFAGMECRLGGDRNLVLTAKTGDSGGNILFKTGYTTTGSVNERARIDSSGRLLVGTSSDVSGEPAALIQSVHSTGALTSIGRDDTTVNNNDFIGGIDFHTKTGASSTWQRSARILCWADADQGSGDAPGRLTFSTTADGASSPTERMRIANNGAISTVVPGGSTLYPAYDCRAWVNFNGTGTVSIRGNGNVSSITDNGTGDYTVNFTTAMADANYSPVVSYRYPSSGDQNSTLSCPANGTAPTTSAIRMRHANAYGGGSAFDTDYISVAIFR